MASFDSYFKPDKPRQSVDTTILKEFEHLVPKELRQLWQRDGFGTYNQGLLQLINPKDYAPMLNLWLGKEVPNYLPFAITGFGELMYYRKLNESDHDICLIDIQFRKIEVLTWEMDDFLNNFLVDPIEQSEWLRLELFEKATEIHGALQLNEIFTLAPILALGGEFSLMNLSKGNAQVYQDLVFSMTS